jgi:hypothetical protein
MADTVVTLLTAYGYHPVFMRHSGHIRCCLCSYRYHGRAHGGATQLLLYSKVSSLFLATSLLFLVGCGQFSAHIKMQPVPPPDLESVVTPPDLGKATNRPLIKKVNDYQTNLSSGHCPDGSAPNAGKCPDGKPISDNFKRVRNEILQAIQAEIDSAYHNYSRTMFAGNAYIGVASDLSVIGLNAAGTVVGASDVKAILAAASGGVTGASASMSKQLFNQQSILSVVAAMDASRAQKDSDMVQRQTKDDIDDYPLEAGIRDLMDYFSRGTLLSGLQWIQSTAGQQKGNSQKLANKTLKVQNPNE